MNVGGILTYSEIFSRMTCDLANSNSSQNRIPFKWAMLRWICISSNSSNSSRSSISSSSYRIISKCLTRPNGIYRNQHNNRMVSGRIRMSRAIDKKIDWLIMDILIAMNCDMSVIFDLKETGFFFFNKKKCISIIKFIMYSNYNNNIQIFCCQTYKMKMDELFATQKWDKSSQLLEELRKNRKNSIKFVTNVEFSQFFQKLWRIFKCLWWKFFVQWKYEWSIFFSW